jgi:hypothetical protein
MQLNFARFWTAAILFLVVSDDAFAQVPDISGQWRNTRRFGVYDLILKQDGNQVTGTYHLGKIQGTLNGNVLTGTYSDIGSSGDFQLTFSQDGNRFNGTARTQNGPDRWVGERTGTLASTPEGVLRARARLDEVQGSGQSFEEQTKSACKNLFAATYLFTQATDTWTTSKDIRPNPFAQQLGAPISGKSYVQVQKVRINAVQSTPISTAGTLNGWQYDGSVSLVGAAARSWAAGGWRPWQDLNGRAFFTCKYQVKSGAASITAVDLLFGDGLISTGAKVEDLVRPTSIPGG